MMKNVLALVTTLMILVLLPLSATGEAEDYVFDYYTYTVTEAGEAVITGYTGDETSLVIPDTVDGYPVTKIGQSAFSENTSISSVVFPQTLTEIGETAFYGCTSLKTVEFSIGLVSVGAYAFNTCSELETVTLPETVTSVGSRAFENCTSLTSVQMPVNVSLLGDAVFEGCEMLEAVEYYGDPVDAEELSEDYVWTVAALTVRLGEELSVFVPSESANGTCLLVFSDDSMLVFDDDCNYISDSTQEELQSKVSDIKKSLQELTDGAIAFTPDPDKASILLTIDIVYSSIGTVTITSYTGGGTSYVPGYICVVTLTATDMQTHEEIGTVILGDSMFSIFGDTEQLDVGLFADFPVMSADDMQSLIDPLLSYLGAAVD